MSNYGFKHILISALSYGALLVKKVAYWLITVIKLISSSLIEIIKKLRWSQLGVVSSNSYKGLEGGKSVFIFHSYNPLFFLGGFLLVSGLLVAVRTDSCVTA